MTRDTIKSIRQFPSTGQEITYTSSNTIVAYDNSYPSESWRRYGATFGAAITAIGSVEIDLLIDEIVAIDDDVTVPVTITLRISKTGRFVLASTKTLTINGGFIAGFYQVFQALTGQVVFGRTCPIEEVYANWWGIVPIDINYIDSNVLSFQAALDTFRNVKFDDAGYGLGSQIVMKKNRQRLSGVGMGWGNDSTGINRSALFFFYQTPGLYGINVQASGCEISNMQIDRQPFSPYWGSAQVLAAFIYINGYTKTLIKNIYFETAHADNFIYSTDGWLTLDRVIFQECYNNTSCVNLYEGGGAGWNTANVIKNCEWHGVVAHGGGAVGPAILMSGGQRQLIRDCIIEGCVGGGIEMSLTQSSQGVTIDGNYFEGNSTVASHGDIMLRYPGGTKAYGFTISNNYTLYGDIIIEGNPEVNICNHIAANGCNIKYEGTKNGAQLSIVNCSKCTLDGFDSTANCHISEINHSIETGKGYGTSQNGNMFLRVAQPTSSSQHWQPLRVKTDSAGAALALCHNEDVSGENSTAALYILRFGDDSGAGGRFLEQTYIGGSHHAGGSADLFVFNSDEAEDLATYSGLTYSGMNVGANDKTVVSLIYLKKDPDRIV